MRLLIVAIGLSACGGSVPELHEANRFVIDRFSAHAGHIMVRDGKNHLPVAGAPIDFTRPPFVTQSFGPDGRVVRYYNFDVQTATPSFMYRMVHENDPHTPIPQEGDLVDTIPGDPTYSDFWQLAYVTVPADFAASSVASVKELTDHNFPTVLDATAFDCPIVPIGTNAPLRTDQEPTEPLELRYRGGHVQCMRFGAPLALDAQNHVPTSPIYVTFNKSPAEPGGGPPSGFRAEDGTLHQTHNVIFSIPGDLDYSPLWQVNVYDAKAFDSVHDAETAAQAPLLGRPPGFVNCPVVYVAESPKH